MNLLFSILILIFKKRYGLLTFILFQKRVYFFSDLNFKKIFQWNVLNKKVKINVPSLDDRIKFTKTTLKQNIFKVKREI